MRESKICVHAVWVWNVGGVCLAGFAFVGVYVMDSISTHMFEG